VEEGQGRCYNGRIIGYNNKRRPERAFSYLTAADVDLDFPTTRAAFSAIRP
jgi:hypothetical protein